MDIGTKGGITTNPLAWKESGLGDLMDQFQSDLELGLKDEILCPPKKVGPERR